MIHPEPPHLARLLLVSAVAAALCGCQLISGDSPARPSQAVLPAGALIPSPRLIIGRIIAVDEARQLVFVEVTADAPKGALIPGTELLVRTLGLRDTGRLQVAPYIRGHTLGAKIVGGQPSTGEEVVWLAP